eukprot:bmy_03448T0
MERPAEEKEDRSPESVACSGCWAGMRGRAPGFRCSPVGAADFQDITPRGMAKAVLSSTLFLLNLVFPRPCLLRGSVSPCHQQSASFGGRRGHSSFLGSSMQWCLLLLWAQGLRPARLPASGAVTGRIVTTGNISAEEGGSVTLQCHLSSTTAKVTQVNWKQQDQVLAIHHASLGWHIDPAFTERMVPGPNLGLTLQSLTRNDTGEYICIYHTYPDGIYKGTLFLEVLQSSVAEHSAGFQIPLLGAMATVLAVIGTAVIVVVTLARKKWTIL